MTVSLPPTLLDETLEYLRRQWTSWFPRARQPRTLTPIIQGTGVGKLIVFILADRKMRPDCVVKVPRALRDNAELAHEYELISELRRRAGKAAASLPEPLAAPVIQGWQIVVEKMLPGSLFTRYVPVGEAFTLETAAEHLRLLTRWYVELQRAAHPRPERLTAADINDLFEEPIAEALRQAALMPHEREFLHAVRERARDLAGAPWRHGFVHGDLRPGNLLYTDGELRVLDWQFGQLRGLPMLDWFEFAYRYFCDAHDIEEITDDHDAYRAAFADVFLGAHPYAELVVEESRACAEALGLSPEHLDLLLAMWLVDNTNKYMRFLGDRAEHGYLYLMQNPPAEAAGGFRQQLRRQVYACLLGQLAHSHGAGAAVLARTQSNAVLTALFPVG